MPSIKEVHMKLYTHIKLILVTLSLLLTNTAYSYQSSSQIMKATAKLSDNSVIEGYTLKNGVRFSAIEQTPRFSKNLVKKLKQLEADTTQTFIQALKNGNEDLGCSLEDAIADIRICFDARAIEIRERFMATIDGKTVGYAIVLDDNADAALIQDGSWIVIYLDDQMNVVAVYTGQS